MQALHHQKNVRRGPSPISMRRSQPFRSQFIERSALQQMPLLFQSAQRLLEKDWIGQRPAQQVISGFRLSAWLPRACGRPFSCRAARHGQRG